LTCEPLSNSWSVSSTVGGGRRGGLGFRDGFTVYEQLHVVGPDSTSARDEYAEDKTARCWLERELDTVLGPVPRAVHRIFLHAVEGNGGFFAVFTHPEARVLRDVFQTEIADEFDLGAGEIDRKDASKG
jgi:hypothetical protein